MPDAPKNLTLQETIAESERRQKRSAAEKGFVSLLAWAARLCVLTILVISPWMIGSVHFGAQFILSVPVLLGLAFWWIETMLSPRKTQVLPYIAIFVAMGIGLGYLQTLPLTDSLSSIMAGNQKDIFARFANATDASAQVRLSLDQPGTWHQLQLLVIAISCLFLGGRYFRTSRQLVIFFSTMLINGVALTAFGLIQKFRFNGKLFWEFELVDGGVPFGPFVCRNNAAGYLVMCFAAGAGLFLYLLNDKKEGKPHTIVSKEIPVWRQIKTHLAVFVGKLDAKNIAVLIALVLICMGVFGSLSRGGTLALLSAVAGGGMIFNMTRRPSFAGLLLLPFAMLVAMIGIWVGLGDELISRFESIETRGASRIDARFETWSDTLPAAFEHGWTGAGLGSYRSVHRLYRNDEENRVYDYAENQYVQTLVEAGIPGLTLLLCAILMAIGYTLFMLNRGNSATSIGVGTFGAVLLSGQLIAAIFDFGWYIPANMVFLATSVGILGYHCHSLASRLKKKSIFRFETPKWLCQVVILSTFLLAVFVVTDLYRKAQVQQASRVELRKGSFESLTWDETNQLITEFETKLRRSPTVSTLNYLGDLHVYRARMQLFQRKLSIDPLPQLEEEQQKRVEKNLWNLTGLVRIHEELELRIRNRDFTMLQQLKSLEALKIDLPKALAYYKASLQSTPLQPVTQLLVGQISFIVDQNNAGEQLEKAIELSPKNPDYRLRTAINFLQHGDIESASKHLKLYLQLDPEHLEGVARLATGRSNRLTPQIDNDTLVNEIIGDQPLLLHQFASEFLGQNDPLRAGILERVNELLVDIPMTEFELLKLKANVSLELGDWETGVEFLEHAVRSDPNDQEVRLQLAEVLYRNNFPEEALEEIQSLIRFNPASKKYKKFLEDVENKIRENRQLNLSEPQTLNQRTPFDGILTKEATA